MGRYAAFASMFAFVFGAISFVFSLIPFLMVFIAWDISILNIDWELTFLAIRINIIISTLIALAFTFSKEGKKFADEFNQQYVKSK